MVGSVHDREDRLYRGSISLQCQQHVCKVCTSLFALPFVSLLAYSRCVVLLHIHAVLLCSMARNLDWLPITDFQDEVKMVKWVCPRDGSHKKLSGTGNPSGIKRMRFNNHVKRLVRNCALRFEASQDLATDTCE